MTVSLELMVSLLSEVVLSRLRERFRQRPDKKTVVSEEDVDTRRLVKKLDAAVRAARRRSVAGVAWNGLGRAETKKASRRAR
jgi:hypothetical protein